MTDILTRLRGTYCCDGINTCNCDESAAEIERLRAALKRIKKATYENNPYYGGADLVVREVARAALAGETLDDAAP